ncbi:MAG TPA: hypothetical protein VH558_11900 [Pseudolabrys sp.]
MLRKLVIGAGLGWSVIFLIVAIRYELQLYADGAMFSYSVAVQDVWAFHWHNIVGRVSVYFLSLWPAEAYVALSGNPAGGILVYGLLFYIAPLIGLAGTFAADHSPNRMIFVYACGSTALLCPLVFGFPTEMWTAHALFWPTLALAHNPRQGPAAIIILAVMMLALVFTHAGGAVLAFTIVVTVAFHGLHHRLFLRGARILILTLAIWIAIRIAYPPDDYFADVLIRAAWGFFDPAIFEVNLVLVLIAVLACYGLLFFVISRLAAREVALLAATSIIAIALFAYWLWFDHWIHASNRYYLRTLLVVITPIFGILATLHAMRSAGSLAEKARLRHLTILLTNKTAEYGLVGAFILVMMVHVVQTSKFVVDWTLYKAAVKTLATGTSADPELGDPRFVSSVRINASLQPLNWFSTVEYLSVIVADFRPKRLVIDPAGNYFWLSCETATANVKATRAVPAAARDLVRVYSCLHR